MTALADLGVELPVIAAPMAGGPTTPELVLAAAGTGALGFLAGGYQTAESLEAQVATVAAATSRFGVNLFAPNPVPVDREDYDRYRARLLPDAEPFGAGLPALPVEDDDAWRDKIDLLSARPVPVVSFTFGIPDAAALQALRRAGSILVQTVTSAGEAARAAAAGVDLIAVQAAAAGGHSATLTPAVTPPSRPLLDLLQKVRQAVDTPAIVAGGIVEPGQVAAAIAGGAQAAMVGTALLLAPEAGTSAAHRRALQEDRGDTVVTRAFTGRPARALANEFLRRHREAPLGYPALHHLTRPLRRAAAAAGDPEFVNLWAGTGYRSVAGRPAGDTLRFLASAV